MAHAYNYNPPKIDLFVIICSKSEFGRKRFRQLQQLKISWMLVASVETFEVTPHCAQICGFIMKIIETNLLLIVSTRLFITLLIDEI
jgi:hypothetical protein